MRTFMTALAVVAVAAGATGCATKKFVRTSVGEVNDKVDSLGRTVEQTQERTRQNETKIAEVDTKATNAGNAAQQANSAASAANNAATAANNNANAVGSKLDAFDKASRRLVLEVVISESSGNFQFGKTDLPDEAKGQIDQLISKLQQDPKNVYFEIEGHTDNVGTAEFNEKLGMERAEAVKMYLYEKHQIPLHKMNVISYGETKPAADNKTKDGRAQNRRVVIRVLG
ncbi:MAG TPA: OmpA family protein [Vicinamibacterales bacterium]|nr:OmpA family protein [Vicinamibacterales bacterium]